MGESFIKKHCNVITSASIDRRLAYSTTVMPLIGICHFLSPEIKFNTTLPSLILEVTAFISKFCMHVLFSPPALLVHPNDLTTLTRWTVRII